MPAYMSHAIMMEKLYKDYVNDNKVFKNTLDINDLKTYSLGLDLSMTSLTLTHNPHEEYTRDFFISMITYIKDNNLVNKNNVISLLYGHIAHYFLDVYAHPFIYYIEKSNKSNTIIPTHHLIEGYLDSYLSEKILKKDVMMLNEKYFNKGKIAKESLMLLNDIYYKIYHAKNIGFIYKRTLYLLSLLEKFIKYNHFSKKDLYRISGLKKFLNDNKLSFIDLNNEKCLYYQNPVNGEYSRKSFLELFYLSIYKTLDAICEVNKYLYDNGQLERLEKVFENLSYDTGLDCKYGHKMVYIKKK